MDETFRTSILHQQQMAQNFTGKNCVKKSDIYKTIIQYFIVYSLTTFASCFTIIYVYWTNSAFDAYKNMSDALHRQLFSHTTNLFFSQSCPHPTYPKLIRTLRYTCNGQSSGNRDYHVFQYLFSLHLQ